MVDKDRGSDDTTAGEFVPSAVSTWDDKPRDPTGMWYGWTLSRVGILLTSFFATWFLIAFFVPVPVGVLLSAVPILVLALGVSALLLTLGMLRSDRKWSKGFRTAVATGIVLGVVASTAFGIAGIFAIPQPTALQSVPLPEPDNFHYAANPRWTDSGAPSGRPVLFFFGSAACPYCSASSWALIVALERFGVLSNATFDYSSSSDVYPSTPETVLSSAFLASIFISLQVAESTYTGAITLPGFANEYQKAYFSAYDSGGSIPFVVIGGPYFTVGTLVSPAALAGLTTAQVQGQISAQSGTGWVAISPAADWLTAYLLKVDGARPASLLTGAILSDYDQIS